MKKFEKQLEDHIDLFEQLANMQENIIDICSIITESLKSKSKIFNSNYHAHHK